MKSYFLIICVGILSFFLILFNLLIFLTIILLTLLPILIDPYSLIPVMNVLKPGSRLIIYFDITINIF